MALSIGVILLIFLAAAALLAVEMLLPTHGVIGAIGVVFGLVGVGAVFYYNQWAGVAVAYGLAAATPFAIAGWLKVWPRTPLGRRMILPSPSSSTEASAAAEVRVGMAGVATSELRPGGTCDLAGHRIGCRAEVGMIPRGTAVRVIAVVDGHPIVRPA